MARDRLAVDIVPGSMWIGAEDVAALVVTVSAGYVTFENQEDGSMRVMHHAAFRKHFGEPYDARTIRSRFEMYLSNLDTFHAYVDSGGKIYARTAAAGSPDDVRTAARGRPALPEDARYVGTYSPDVIVEPRWKRKALFAFDVFLEDLHGLLRRVRRHAEAVI
jgi:hypothetical protein